MDFRAQRRILGSHRRGGRHGSTLVLAAIVTALTIALAATALAVAPGYAQAAVAWGQNYPHEELGAGYKNNYAISPVPVSGPTNITAMAAGGDHSFALLANGTLEAWGGNDYGQLANGTRNESGTPTPISGYSEDVKAVAAASYHDIAALKNGEVIVWGESAYGELGNGTKGEVNPATGKLEHTFSLLPIKVEGLKEVIAVAAAGGSDFALEENGTLMAWGRASDGMLGSTGPSETCYAEATKTKGAPCVTKPRAVNLENVPAGVKITAISAGADSATGDGSAYALLSNGTVLAWGYNNYGELGNGQNTTNSAVPSPVNLSKLEAEQGRPLKVVAVSAGNIFGLAILEGGEVIGWGENRYGQLGYPSSTESCTKEEIKYKRTWCSNNPKLVNGLHNVSAISAGSGFALALSQGMVYAFGDNEHGQLGIGSTTSTHVPTVVNTEEGGEEGQPLTGVVGVAAGDGPTGEAHSFAFRTSAQEGLLPQVSVTPEADSLKVIWTIQAAEYKIQWRRAGEGPGWPKPNTHKVKGECSQTQPCKDEVLGLTEGQPYELRFFIGGGIKWFFGLPGIRALCGAPAPTVTSVSPSAGPLAGGTAVSIAGSGFGSFCGAEVKFGAISAPAFSVTSPSEINGISPSAVGAEWASESGEAHTVDVIVSTERGSSAVSMSDQFSFEPPPTVAGVSPNAGTTTGGTAVTISGTNLSAANEVKFGSVKANFTVKSSQSITATSPAETYGTVDVTVTTPLGTSATSPADQFTFAPTITGMSPSGGPTVGGTLVTVTGTGFAAGTNATTFEFGSAKASVVSCASSTECSVVAPSHAAGVADVTASVSGVRSPLSAADRFTYTEL